MNADSAAPHVNFELLSRYQNRRVRLAGTVVGLSSDILQVKAADGGIVNVKLRTPAHFEENYILITGTATGRDSVSEERHQTIGNEYGVKSVLAHPKHAQPEADSVACHLQTWRSTTICANFTAHLNSTEFSYEHDVNLTTATHERNS